jgi:hypothetical protein
MGRLRKEPGRRGRGGAQGGITDGGGHRVKPLGDPLEQALDRTGGRQVQLDAVFEWDNPHGLLEQLEDEPALSEALLT